MKQCFGHRTDSIHKNVTGIRHCAYNVLIRTRRSFLAHYVPVQAEPSLATITNPVFGQHRLTIY